MAMANEATNQHLPLPALRQLRGAPFAARLTGLLALTLVGMLAGARTAHAVETTDVLDAFDDDNGDPFDMALRVRFQNESRTATIGRESRCLVGDAIGNGLCGSHPQGHSPNTIEHGDDLASSQLPDKRNLFRKHPIAVFVRFPVTLGILEPG